MLLLARFRVFDRLVLEDFGAFETCIKNLKSDQRAYCLSGAIMQDRQWHESKMASLGCELKRSTHWPACILKLENGFTLSHSATYNEAVYAKGTRNRNCQYTYFFIVLNVSSLFSLVLYVPDAVCLTRISSQYDVDDASMRRYMYMKSISTSDVIPVKTLASLSPSVSCMTYR